MKVKVIRVNENNPDCITHKLLNKIIYVQDTTHKYYIWSDESNRVTGEAVELIDKSYCANWEDFDDNQLELFPNFPEYDEVNFKTIKNDSGKPQYSDLPVRTLKSVTKAFNYGAAKYSKFNYTKGLEWLRYYDACMRHMEAWREFENLDEESTNHHIDHAIASLMMLRENIHLNKGEDNRNKDYK